METVYAAVTQLGQIFDVPNVAKVLNADIRNDFAVAKAALKKAGMPSLKAVILQPSRSYVTLALTLSLTLTLTLPLPPPLEHNPNPNSSRSGSIPLKAAAAGRASSSAEGMERQT